MRWIADWIEKLNLAQYTAHFSKKYIDFAI